MNKNIYIIGPARGAYRTQNLIKILMDQKYNVYYNSLILKKYLHSESLVKKIIRKALRAFEEVFLFFYKLYFIAISDIVFLTAMNNQKQLEFNLARLFKKKIITDFYISFYDTFILDRRTFPDNSKMAKKIRNKDRNIIEKSDIVLFLTEAEAKRYIRLCGLDINNINYKIVPLCVENRKSVNLPYFNGKNKQITICWWGSYIPLHGIEKIIHAGKLLKNIKNDFVIYLFGNSENKSMQYKNMINGLNLSENIKIINNYTFVNGKLDDFLVNNCDLVLGNFGDSDKSKNVLVNKVIDGVAMKSPVLTGESIATKEFFSYKESIFYSKNTPESIAEEIIKIMSLKKDIIRKRVENAYSIYEEYFSENAFKKNIISILENCKNS